MFKPTTSHHGMMLIECLMALLLSVLLLGLLGTLFFAASKNHAAALANSALQDNAAFALQQLGRAIQQAGAIGCARLTPDFPLQGELSPRNRLEGTDDQVTVRGGGMESGYLLQPMQAPGVLFVSGDLPVLPDDQLIVSDCHSADIIQVRTVEKISATGQKIIARLPLSTLYQENAEVRHYEVSTFFVAPTKRLDARHKRIVALYRSRHHHYRTEMVEGVDALHLRYEILKDQHRLTVAADQVGDWSTVVGVHLEMALSATQAGSLHKTRYGYAVLSE